MIVWIVSKAIEIFREKIMQVKVFTATKYERIPAIVRINLILFCTVAS
jgi:hypothetical protein